MIDNKTPFPLVYLDWCKARGIKTIKETENRELIHEFYHKVWEPAGREITGVDYAIARGLYG